MSKNTIDQIELVSVDQYGTNWQAAGTWNGQSYRIDIALECDGRDAESESAYEDGYDPMADFDSEDPFFDRLCEDERFVKLNNAAYKCWELFPREDD